MPPKKQDKGGGGSKVKEDKTFGLKNKNKSARVQAQVALIKQQEAQVGKNKEARMKDKEREAAKKKKEAETRRKEEITDLIKPVAVQQKIPFGVDPKTLLCINFKNGVCERGARCKFSHDLNVGRKVEKADIYTDTREEEKLKDKDNSANWSEDKLKEVVETKNNNPNIRTHIVCKHFIDAIERGVYGWFWECPDGGVNCKYRHALPPGFVLKSQRKKEEEDAEKNQISLEEFLEVERHKLGKALTPVTADSFATWKKNRLSKKEAEADAITKAKAAQAAAGKANGMSGRDLFTFNPELYQDSDDEGDDWDLSRYRKETEQEREEAERERIRWLGTGSTAELEYGEQENGALEEAEEESEDGDDDDEEDDDDDDDDDRGEGSSKQAGAGTSASASGT